MDENPLPSVSTDVILIGDVFISVGCSPRIIIEDNPSPICPTDGILVEDDVSSTEVSDGMWIGDVSLSLYFLSGILTDDDPLYSCSTDGILIGDVLLPTGFSLGILMGDSPLSTHFKYEILRVDVSSFTHMGFCKCSLQETFPGQTEDVRFITLHGDVFTTLVWGEWHGSFCGCSDGYGDKAALLSALDVSSEPLPLQQENKSLNSWLGFYHWEVPTHNQL
jgi:hypothetical protein